MIARDTGELRVSMELLKELGLIEGIERMGWIDTGWDQHVELATFWDWYLRERQVVNYF